MFKKCHDHLHSVDESYFKHLRFASGVGIRLIGAGFAGIMHGLCPALFQTTSSQTIFKLHDEMKSRLKHTAADHTHG